MVFISFFAKKILKSVAGICFQPPLISAFLNHLFATTVAFGVCQISEGGGGWLNLCYTNWKLD